MNTINAINNRLQKIEKEKQILLDRLKELKEINKKEKPRVSLRIIKEKYIIGSTRNGNKIETIYLGNKKQYKNWKTSKMLKRLAVEKMKDKLR